MSPERLQELLNAFVDDQLDAAGQRELAKALERDEEARRAFVRATSQHQALRDLLGRPAAAPAKQRSWLPVAALAAAAALLVALSVYLLRPIPAATPPSDVVTKEKKPTPPRPPAPEPAPTPPEPKPEPRPDPKPAPQPIPPTPPAPTSKEPEKSPEPKPVAPEPKPPEAPPLKPPPPPPPPRETAIAIATLENVRGEVFALVAGERKPVATGQAIASGQGLSIGAGNAVATLVFPDATRLELRPGTLLSEISAVGGKKVVMDLGSLYADVAKQPAGQPMLIATKHAEATVLGTKLALSSAEATKLELKEGKVRFTRSEDKKSVEVTAGHSSIAGKGHDLAPRKITRGPMMAEALWGEDFQEPEELDKDWSISRSGILVTTTRGQLDFDLSPGGTASLGTRAGFAAPFRITVDVEFTQRLKGSLLGLRLQDWKQEKQFIHVDLDEERYYFMAGEQSVTADVPRRTPRRERWTLEVGGDGAVTFLVDGKPVVKGRRPAGGEEYHVSLVAKSAKDVLPGTHVRFDNLVIEKPK